MTEMAVAAAAPPPQPVPSTRNSDDEEYPWKFTGRLWFRPALVREPPTPIAARGSRPRVEVVFARCHEPLSPVLRMLPAFLPAAARLRADAAVLVFERCARGAHLWPDVGAAEHEAVIWAALKCCPLFVC